MCRGTSTYSIYFHVGRVSTAGAGSRSTHVHIVGLVATFIVISVLALVFGVSLVIRVMTLVIMIMVVFPMVLMWTVMIIITIIILMALLVKANDHIGPCLVNLDSQWLLLWS